MHDDIESRMARIEERIDNVREAIDVAKQDVDRRLEGMNELRGQIANERGTYLTRQQYDDRHRELERRLETIRDELGRRIDEARAEHIDFNRRIAALEGGSQLKAATIGWLLAGLGLVITVVVVVVNVITL